jgi:hypothetical protein
MYVCSRAWHPGDAQRSWVQSVLICNQAVLSLRIVPTVLLHICPRPRHARLDTMMLMKKGVGKMTGSKVAVTSRSHVSSYAACLGNPGRNVARCLHWQRMESSSARYAVLC